MYLEWHENESFLKRSHAIELITWFFHFKLYFFLFSPSDWHNLLQWYVLVWLVASSLSHIQSTIFVLHCILAPAFDFTLGSWLILWLYSTMPGHLHTMPKSDEDIQIQVEQVFGFHPCFWQIHGCPYHACWQGCHPYCSNRVHEVFDLLDASALHQVWNYNGCYTFEASWRAVLEDAAA